MEDLIEIIVALLTACLPRKLTDWIEKQNKAVKAVFMVAVYVVSAIIMGAILYALWSLFSFIVNLFGGNEENGYIPMLVGIILFH